MRGWSIIAGVVVALNAHGRVELGVDVLAARGFAELRGQRVGLLTHDAATNGDGVPTWRVLHEAAEVELVALMAPEHGLSGLRPANEGFDAERHGPSGLVVHSLYGPTRQPTPTMLAGLDGVVIDLQEIGVRSYTYASAMKLTLEACFAAGLKVVILDRPNPLGGELVDGPILEARWRSYVGAFPVPYVHGLTMGELARMAVGMGWLEGEARGRLVVVPMRGWERSMRWDGTGLRWRPTSPNIPNLGAVLGYAMTGLGAQVGPFKHGLGTRYPFRLLSYGTMEAVSLQRALDAEGIAGVAFEVREGGVFVRVTDWTRLRPTAVSFHMMRLTARWEQGNPFAALTEGERELFNKHVGSTAWWEALERDGGAVEVEAFLAQWEREAAQFRARSRAFWLYDGVVTEGF